MFTQSSLWEDGWLKGGSTHSESCRAL